jgi:hypothetical protein
MRRNQISSFDQTDESIYIGRGVSSVDYWQASCAHQPAGFVLPVQACVLQLCDAYWLPTPFSCFPFTSPPCVTVCHHISKNTVSMTMVPFFEGTFASMCRVCHSFFVSPCLTTHVKFPKTTGTIFVKSVAGKLQETLSIPFKFWLKLGKEMEK